MLATRGLSAWGFLRDLVQVVPEIRRDTGPDPGHTKHGFQVAGATPHPLDTGRVSEDDAAVRLGNVGSAERRRSGVGIRQPVGLDGEIESGGGDAAIESAVSLYVAAFGEGDADAAALLLSEWCTATVPIPEHRAAVAAAGELYPGLAIDEISDIVRDEDVAVVYYMTDPVVEEGDGERWILESDTWRWDDC